MKEDHKGMAIDEIDLGIFSSHLLAILGECVYNPTPERLNERITSYYSRDNTHVFAYRVDDDYQGILIVTMIDKILTINEVAVAKAYQKNGIGRSMINFLMESYSPEKIIAETDDDAVDFYRRCGFTVQSLGEKYPGFIRYQCILSN